LANCLRHFDFWTFFLSIFEIPKKVLTKKKKRITSGVGTFLEQKNEISFTKM
jgi:hypothetical protein